MCVKYVALIWGGGGKFEIHGIGRQARKSSQNWHCRLVSKGNLKAEFSFSYKDLSPFSRKTFKWLNEAHLHLSALPESTDLNVSLM